MIEQKKITIFYSWQSDLPDDTNRRAIRVSLHKAIAEVEDELSDKNIVINLDEATRDVSGSPNIPATIIEKIKASDIFVADISIINSKSSDARPCPNPNVVYELGFATGELGWARMIMLLNTNYGDLSKDLPFDFDRHRVSPYKVDDKKDKNGKKSLTDLLVVALKSVIENDPVKASKQKGLSEEEKMRYRDQSNIEWALSALHIPSLDDHISNSPYMLMDKALHFWIGFNGIMVNSLFHLYDKELEGVFRRFHSAWGVSLNFDQYYHQNTSGNAHIFGNHGDSPLSENQQKAWNTIFEANLEMRKSLDIILSLVRVNYLDIDINETNKNAWCEYIKFKKEEDELSA